MRVKVGCCGFSMSMKRYFQVFRVVEVQKTFYSIPRDSTLERWRAEAGEGFEFTVKAFQAITHPPTSPTWRRSGLKVERDRVERYGMLRPTEENFEAWDRTLRAARILDAKIVVVQTPPRFGYSEEHVRRLYDFFGSVERKGINVVWEPRGTWGEHPEELSRIMRELDLIHGVDLLRREPLSDHPILYSRLHGLGPREVNYRYKYTRRDLDALRDRLVRLSERYREAYVMFNNVYMGEDALEFKRVCRGSDVLECV